MTHWRLTAFGSNDWNCVSMSSFIYEYAEQTPPIFCECSTIPMWCCHRTEDFFLLAPQINIVILSTCYAIGEVDGLACSILMCLLTDEIQIFSILDSDWGVLGYDRRSLQMSSTQFVVMTYPALSNFRSTSWKSRSQALLLNMYRAASWRAPSTWGQVGSFPDLSTNWQLTSPVSEFMLFVFKSRTIAI